jgi:hypothetical protein
MPADLSRRKFVATPAAAAAWTTVGRLPGTEGATGPSGRASLLLGVASDVGPGAGGGRRRRLPCGGPDAGRGCQNRRAADAGQKLAS